MEAIDIERELNEELLKQENEIAEKFGAVPVENKTIFEMDSTPDLNAMPLTGNIEYDDKGKEEMEPEIPELKNIEIDLSQPPPSTQTAKKKKDDLVKDIIELQKQNGIIPTNPGALMKKKKQELEVILAHLFDYSVKKQSGIPGTENQALDLSGESVAENLFMMNFAFCKMTEHISETFKKFTYGENFLEGWSQDIENNKKTFLIVLAKIFKEHRDIIIKYATPLGVWAFLMITSATKVVASNIEKKKK